MASPGCEARVESKREALRAGADIAPACLYGCARGHRHPRRAVPAPIGCARPSTRVHAAAGVCGLAEGFRRTEAVIVKMRYLRLEHGWDKYISLERSRRDLYDPLISPHF